MQRRAATVYLTLFVLIGAGAYGFVQVGMSEPTVDLDGPTYSEGDELTVGDRTYTVSSVETEQGEVARNAGDVELAWFNESGRETATLDNGSTVEFDGNTHRVVVAGADLFQLVEEQNVSAVLAADPDVENETVTRGGEELVVYRDNQSIQPLPAYLSDPDRVEFTVGDSLSYQAENVTARVDGVSSSGASLSWRAPSEETVTLSSGENTTLSGVDYFAHFPSEGQVQILRSDQQYGRYLGELETIEYWGERRNGLWGIVLLSFVASVVLAATAYLPVKS